MISLVTRLIYILTSSKRMLCHHTPPLHPTTASSRLHPHHFILITSSSPPHCHHCILIITSLPLQPHHCTFITATSPLYPTTASPLLHLHHHTSPLHSHCCIFTIAFLITVSSPLHPHHCTLPLHPHNCLPHHCIFTTASSPLHPPTASSPSFVVCSFSDNHPDCGKMQSQCNFNLFFS